MKFGVLSVRETNMFGLCYEVDQVPFISTLVIYLFILNLTMHFDGLYYLSIIHLLFVLLTALNFSSM